MLEEKAFVEGFQYHRLCSMLRKNNNIPAQGLVHRGQLNKYFKINYAVLYIHYLIIIMK